MIPGSMADPAFVVRGHGNPQSLNSASHGAGRRMSRTKANDMFRIQAVQKDLAKRGVHVLSAGSDEVPGVYKDIRQVMARAGRPGRDRRAVRSEDREDVRRREPGGGLRNSLANVRRIDRAVPGRRLSQIHEALKPGGVARRLPQAPFGRCVERSLSWPRLDGAATKN